MLVATSTSAGTKKNFGSTTINPPLGPVYLRIASFAAVNVVSLGAAPVTVLTLL